MIAVVTSIRTELIELRLLCAECMASVLIVDDEQLLLDCLSEYLTLSGHDVIKAAGCEQALALLRATVPDVLVTDLHLRDGQAADLIGVANGMERAPSVIVISGRDELPPGFSQFRISATIAKPFDPSMLVDAIRASLGVVS